MLEGGEPAVRAEDADGEEAASQTFHLEGGRKDAPMLTLKQISMM